jgi:hypothetical protein
MLQDSVSTYYRKGTLTNIQTCHSSSRIFQIHSPATSQTTAGVIVNVQSKYISFATPHVFKML